MPPLELASLEQIGEELKRRNVTFVLAWLDHTALASRENEMYFSVDAAGPVILQKLIVEQMGNLVKRNERAMYEPEEAEGE